MQKSKMARGIAAAQMALDLKKMTRATDETVRREARRTLATRMGKLRGLPQKLGQSLSLRAEADEADEADIFGELAQSAEPLPFAVIEQELLARWGVPWQEVLASLEPVGLAASLGQVHQGTLKDGRKVAVKVAYPGIREAVMADLKLLGWLGKAGEQMMAGFDMGAYREVILRDLEEELDYQKEAAQQIHYKKLVGRAAMCVPQVVSEWSNASVLVTAWEMGQTIEEARSWPEPARVAIGQLLAQHFLHMFFDHGWIHADPHQGNYRFRKPHDPEVVLYDYGSVARFDKKLRLTLLRLILMTRQQQGDPFPLLVGLGFREDLLRPLRPKLSSLCQVLFEPFLVRGRYVHKDWNRSERANDILGDDRWNFRMSGPAQMTFLIRGFQGVFYYLNQLNVALNWYELLDRVLPKHLAEVMTLRIPKVDQGPGFESLAKHLCIRLMEDGKQKVALTFPANAIERLPSLMGEHILNRVLAQGIQPETLISQARAAGFAPSELFVLEEGNRTLRVWLA